MNEEIRIINFQEQKMKKRYPNEFIRIFEEYIQVDCEGDYSIENMMYALGLVNEKLTASMSDEMTVEFVDSIIDATFYIAGKMFTSTENEQKIIENWHGYPLLFQIGATFEYEKHKATTDAMIEQFSVKEKELFNKMMGVVWECEENRRIVFDEKVLRIDKDISDVVKEEALYMVKYMIAIFITGGAELGLFTFTKELPDGDVTSALSNINGIISIVDPEVLKYCYTHDANGKKLPKASIDVDDRFEEFDIVL